ncbi:MAG: glycosyl hydrolase [Anaerolineae bacterium]
MVKKHAEKSATGRVTLLIGTRKGGFILRGNKARDKWKMQAPIMIGAVIHHMVLDPRDGETLLMAAHTGHLGPTIFRSLDGGETWQEAQRPPAFPKAAEGQRGEVIHHNFWLAPAHVTEPGVWYAGSSPPGLFRSEDGGVTWEGVAGFNSHPLRSSLVGAPDEGPPGGATLHSIMIDPRDLNHMYFCLSGGGVFESTDKGEDWKPCNKGLVSDFLPQPDAEVGHDPHCMRMHPLDPDRLYQQNHCGIYRMDRAQGVWVNIGKNLPKVVSDHSYPIVLHPRDPDTAWVFPLDGTFPLGRVSPRGRPATYVTHNAGATWKRQDKGFPRENGWFTVKRQAMTADRHDPLGLYLGTTGGEIWASIDEGKSWESLYAHLPEIYSVEAAEI